MTLKDLEEQIRSKGSFLCVGLDSDMERIPPHLLDSEDPIFSFNKEIIDATAPYCVAYKPNTAFYESQGIKGWRALERTIQYLNKKYPEIFTIADAKRGDIGNTSRQYAKAFFEDLGFDAVTVAPYMGSDSVEPFLAYEDKYTILLALTSNSGAQDYQLRKCEGEPLYKRVLSTARKYSNSDRLMFVVGATKAEYIREIRSIAPNAFLLVPGVGAQGGDLHAVCENGLTKGVGLLVNASRSIIFASAKEDFAHEAARAAAELQGKMKNYLL